MQKSEINMGKSENSHQVRYRKMNLNVNCTFDNFVIGDCNKMAQEAAVYVSKNPGRGYNPLFIWSKIGLGKTHLLLAIRDYISGFDPEKSVLYVDAEWFVKEVVHNIRYGTMTEFREKYRTVDVLLLDNIQHILGKKSTQEEFFHTFDTIFAVGKQIVITGDKPPKEMNIVDEKFKSRLSCGLIVDIQLPDYDTRKEVIQKLAQRHQKGIEEEAVNYIARSVVSNIAELVDIMDIVIRESRRSNGEINTKLVVRVIEETKQQENKITPKLIIDTVVEYFEITTDDIMSEKRSEEIMYPRQIAMYLCSQMTKETLSSIGKVFGRNHSTVRNSIAKIEMNRKVDSEINNKVENIIKKLLQ